MRTFSSYGPLDPRRHFCVPRADLIQRCVQQLVGDPIEGGHYFTIWAPRQTGKTWIMRRAIEELRAQHGERFLIGALSMQDVQLLAAEPPEAFLRRVPMLLRDWLNLSVPAPTTWEEFAGLFRRGTSPLERPLILMIDEFDRLPQQAIDALVGQFRALFLHPETSLLHGLALIGVRAVLGVQSDRGSPFNIQRSLQVPNLTRAEVTELLRQYQQDSGQAIDAEVVAELYEVTRGQPGLCNWFGELLTEKYNLDPVAPINRTAWARVYSAACQIEPNNTVLNLLKKARRRRYRRYVVQLFAQANVPFSFDQDWCNYLFLNGIIDHQEVTDSSGQATRVCRFSCPFLQHRLYSAFTGELSEPRRRVPVVDPRDDLTGVFATLDLPALLQRYRDYLRRARERGESPWHGQPRRADLHLTEAVGHFHLYWWLVEATRGHLTVSPEFPTGNGKVDLLVRQRERTGVIEVKSFTQRSDLPTQRQQAARYARSRGLSAAMLVIFVPTEDEELLAELSGAEDCDGVLVNLLAIGAA